MPAFATKGIVLRRVDYRDNARMVTLFSPHLGMITANARGCHSPKSPLTNATEIFFFGDYQLYKRGEHVSISQCQRIESFYDIRMDYDRFRHGAYWLSLTEALIQPDQPHTALFEHLLRGLTCLCEGGAPGKWTLAYTLGAMTIEGYRPSLVRCAQCGGAIVGDTRFSPEHGGCLCGQCPGRGRYVTLDTRELMATACSEEGIRAFIAYDPPEPALTAALKLTPQYIDARLERRVRAAITNT